MNDTPTQLGSPHIHLKHATGLRRIAYIVAGLFSVGMAYLGAIIPGLPATPWVLLASYCFSKSSPRLGRWLRRSPIFGGLLRDWDEHRGIRKHIKIIAVCMVATMVTISLVLGGLPVWVKCIVVGWALIGVSTIIFLVPTIKSRSTSVTTNGTPFASKNSK